MICKEIMTPNPKTCTTAATAQEAARIMQEGNLGVVPVVKEKTRKLVGVVTDRDLCLAVVAKGWDPRSVLVSDCMNPTVVTCKPDDAVELCEQEMRTYQVRRIPVVDDDGRCIGIISQGDIAVHVTKAEEVHETLKEISKPGPARAA